MTAQALIAGNWKMNGSSASAKALAGDLAARAKGAAAKLPRIALCPPAALISTVAAAVAGSAVAFGAQDCHAKDKGAHTGDTSAVLLKDLGCTYVIVGHSERRADHGESNESVRAKAEAALAAGLVPIICVGETEAERDAGKAADVVRAQVAGSVPAKSSAASIVIAYEPVWAIGTGRTPTPDDVKAMHAVVRETYAKSHSDSADLAILYGGSVKGSNAATLLAVPGVDGALVGGASLDAADFWTIIENAPKR
ncbi:MAG: triose-phosphate isomerase [Rhodospirillaceae bacterium]|nr:triose-phosphate isomerase [Rhodospirillaceae bacterium]